MCVHALPHLRRRHHAVVKGADSRWFETRARRLVERSPVPCWFLREFTTAFARTSSSNVRCIMVLPVLALSLLARHGYWRLPSSLADLLKLMFTSLPLVLCSQILCDCALEPGLFKELGSHSVAEVNTDITKDVVFLAVTFRDSNDLSVRHVCKRSLRSQTKDNANDQQRFVGIPVSFLGSSTTAFATPSKTNPEVASSDVDDSHKP